jgi:hypothetical protein
MASPAGAELTPEGVHDFLSISPGPTKDLIRDLLLGIRPFGESTAATVFGDFGEDDESDSRRTEVVRDTQTDWSWLRVDGYLVVFRPLTEDERSKRGRRGAPSPGLGDTLVAGIRPVAELILRNQDA